MTERCWNCEFLITAVLIGLQVKYTYQSPVRAKLVLPRSEYTLKFIYSEFNEFSCSAIRIVVERSPCWIFCSYCCRLHVLHYLVTPLADINLRCNFELPEENHVFITMKSEDSTPSPWSKMGLDRSHQDPTVVHLYVLTVHRDWHWKPDTTFWRAIRTRSRLDKH